MLPQQFKYFQGLCRQKHWNWNGRKRNLIHLCLRHYPDTLLSNINRQLIVWNIQMLLFTKTRKVHEAKNPSSTSDILQDVALKTKTHWYFMFHVSFAQFWEALISYNSSTQNSKSYWMHPHSQQALKA